MNGENMVIWITGLSGAGKTTVAKHLVSILKSEGIHVVHLDGDILRDIFFSDITGDPHSSGNRLRIAYKYSALCAMLSRQDITVVMSTISLFKEIHQWNRDNINPYFEVFLDVPIEILQERDVKGIYARYEEEKISSIYGLDLEFDYPHNADMVFCHNAKITAEDIAERIFKQSLLKMENIMAPESSVKVEWDYTEHAQHYDKRADYSELAISKLIAITDCQQDKLTADIGAGTGKLTKELLKLGLTVISVEPNAAMREFGIKNTLGQKVEWRIGTGEETGITDRAVQAAFFGSSFNVVDQQRALIEIKRILEPKGWFACMWNHRDLDEKIQTDIELIIKGKIKKYSYGSRREDPTEAINKSGLFGEVKKIEERFITEMTRDEILIAWKSHATLRREAGSDAVFDSIISDIENYLSLLPEPVLVPYFTRIYTAQLK